VIFLPGDVGRKVEHGALPGWKEGAAKAFAAPGDFILQYQAPFGLT